MASGVLRSEERVGLALALAAHAALLLLLVVRPSSEPAFKPPERIEVSISDLVGPKSTSPEPNAEARPDVAPVLGAPAPPEPAPPAPPAPPEPRAQPQPRPVPRRVEAPAPKPAPKPVPKPRPRPEERSKPEPKPKHEEHSKPAPKPKPEEQREPAPSPKKSSGSSRSSSAAKHTAPTTSTRPTEHTGGSRIGSDFLKGIQGAKGDRTTGMPADQIGPNVLSSLSAAVARQLKPHWQQPDGVDVDKISTTLEWSLNEDGSLNGAPTLVSQTGVNDTNRAQAARHIEMAKRAVRLAAPFTMPAKYYSAWRKLRFTFDWKLNQ